MKTKIIATIGPASDNARIFGAMAEEGMNIARINTKYGDEAEYEKIISCAHAHGVKVLYDIKGDEKLAFLKDQDFDFLAVSDTESAQQLAEIRQFFAPRKIKIIAKIESPLGIEKLTEIIEASDGVMVARGDLGKTMTPEKVPIFQKLIIHECNEKNKFVITATEMMLSMTEATVPERAEVSDVANAIIDGTDAVMLSEETSIGSHPILVVREMKKIIVSTEKNLGLLETIQD